MGSKKQPIMKKGGERGITMAGDLLRELPMRPSRRSAKPPGIPKICAKCAGSAAIEFVLVRQPMYPGSLHTPSEPPKRFKNEKSASEFRCNKLDARDCHSPMPATRVIIS